MIKMETRRDQFSQLLQQQLQQQHSVYVNPNFISSHKNSVIHINPRIHQKIHVNPKVMIQAPDKEVQELITVQQPVQRSSIHVNPKLMNKLSGIGQANKISQISVPASEKTPMTIAHVTCPEVSRLATTCQNVVPKPTTITKTCQPDLLVISQRKLVRVRDDKKTATTQKKNYQQEPVVLNPVGKRKKLPILPRVTKSGELNGTNKYKIDRTLPKVKKSERVLMPDGRIRNVNKGLVAIGGVMYQSSKTRLVRSSDKKSNSSNVVTTAAKSCFVTAANGKKLIRRRLTPNKSLKFSNQTTTTTTPRTKSTGSRQSIDRRRSFVTSKKMPNSFIQTSPKNVISDKVKRRSLQILRDKLRKNFIPCLIYRRFGYCANHAKGTCSKLHDKKQVSLCRNFLQGKCLFDDCLLSHDIGPEKMPTCKYFLEGCCIRENCPYLHVKVSANTKLCPQFLRGYCAEGTKCKHRHAYICEEFDKSGKCSKGKYCPYPHKVMRKPMRKTGGARDGQAVVLKATPIPISSSTPTTKSLVAKHLHRKRSKSQEISPSSLAKIPRVNNTRLRYYDGATPLSETSHTELSHDVQERIMKKVQLMKAAHGFSSSPPVEEIIIDDGKNNIDDHHDDSHNDDENDGEEKPKRPPIGPLPAYIPID